MKYDLKDCTFLIPVRLDSIDRLVNLRAILIFLEQHFETNIHILEADRYNTKLIQGIISSNVKYSFIKDYDPIFHRTMYINKMVRDSHTSIVSVWDTDVIIPPHQVVKSIDLLRNNKNDFVTPYMKKFLDVPKIIGELFFKSKDWQLLEKHKNKMKLLYRPNPVGGAFFAQKKEYIESGLENTNFYGWGIEDGERVNRWIKLGYRFSQVEGPLFHLTHSRGSNSVFHSVDQRKRKTNEFNRICSLTKEELEKEIANW
ncbi:hypothetical protein EYV94_14040 [Puteibacter caeruleilacunae]|nr:hypothetical protein EYV94_14040 [Puteibacter caeruleilacunae]